MDSNGKNVQGATVEDKLIGKLGTTNSNGVCHVNKRLGFPSANPTTLKATYRCPSSGKTFTGSRYGSIFAIVIMRYDYLAVVQNKANNRSGGMANLPPRFPCLKN
jgi:hypothetical protein